MLRVVQHRVRIAFSALAITLAGSAAAQSTDGLISGRISDVLTQQPVSGAIVTCVNLATHTTRSVKTGTEGLYALTSLPPGTYQIRVSEAAYQAKEQDDVRLGVADSLELNLTLRPLRDIWESSMQSSVLLPESSTILNFHGPDVDPNHWTAFAPNAGASGKLEASLSYVVSPADIRELPLNGDNIYSVLLAEPGVTADAATSRSLGIAANGQRPSASNYLLDGVEANFYLVSGPVLAVPPEATQEYRVSTNNFAAEYGGASGYIANTVTRSGGDAWHGVAYFNLENTILNANDFQANLSGSPRTPSKQDRLGGFVGGPIWKKRLFTGTSIEYFRSRTQMDPQSYNLPAAPFLQLIGCPSATNYACQLLRDYPIPNSQGLVGSVTLSQPVSVDQYLGLQRLDYARPDSPGRVTMRLMASNLSRPDFIWSPYRDFTSGLAQPVYNVAASWTESVRPDMTNQLSGGWSDQRLSWARANPQVPTLVVTSGNVGQIPLLPGSPAAYAFNDSSRYAQIYDNFTAIRGRHIMKAGAGGIWRLTDDSLGYGLDGEYFFCNIERFGLNLPGCPSSIPGQQIPAVQFSASLARGAAQPTQPDLDRSYSTLQYYAFAADTFRVTPRLVVNFGLRLDYFGAPQSVGGAKDWMVRFGTGSSFDQRLANASLQPPSTASSALFTPGGPAVAPRTGFAYDLGPATHTILRGGFGIFYDRLYDNLWLNARNNSFVFPSPVALPGYLPVSSALTYASNFVSDFPRLTAFQPHLHNGYAEDFFLGVQTEPVAGLAVEVNGAGSLGRRLVTNDVINRNSLANTSLPAMTYLSNQGLSDYYSLNVVTRWRTRHGFLQGAYTWSHAIDIQSDPLAGNLFDLDFVNVGPAPGSSPVAPNGAAFSNPNDSRSGRGNADFDQRHTLVFFSYWQIPRSGNSLMRRVLGGLTFSQLAAIRSGFPYSIFTAISSSTPEVINAYARPLSSKPLLAAPQPAPGGQRLFTASAFCADDTCPLPPSGRNAFAGPGLINLDVSASRTFGLRWLGESGALMVRADAFNFLNHPNLNPPGNIPGSPDYGIAVFGTPPQTTGFPAVVPLAQTARNVQLMIRILF